MTEEVQFIIDSMKEQMEKAITHLETELVKIRAGRANPSMLDGLFVDYYGVRTPLNQVSNINTPDARTLAIQPWEKSMLEPIQKAILAANLGFNPTNNGTMVIINVPALTEERRKDLVKKTKAEGEHAKVSIRTARKEANEELKQSKLTEDEKKSAEEKIQQITDTYTAKVDKHLEQKEKEIMTV
ncbi:MAG: ribosome recycling factor [Bacteroidota bacterium]